MKGTLLEVLAEKGKSAYLLFYAVIPDFPVDSMPPTIETKLACYESDESLEVAKKLILLTKADTVWTTVVARHPFTFNVYDFGSTSTRRDVVAVCCELLHHNVLNWALRQIDAPSLDIVLRVPSTPSPAKE